MLKHVALAAPEIDVGLLADDLFGGMPLLAEHYLWQLELDGFVDHAGDERQTSLIPTAEGASVLFMLELTKPGTNENVMSVETLGLAAEADAPKPRTIEVWREEIRLGVPRFRPSH